MRARVAMTGPRPDVLVVGAGAIGAACAYELAVAGLRVTVILYVATGHSRSGILLTPVTARIIRDWIVEGRSALPADGFLPDRLLR